VTHTLGEIPKPALISCDLAENMSKVEEKKKPPIHKRIGGFLWMGIYLFISL
jgi:hypothetical protein